MDLVQRAKALCAQKWPLQHYSDTHSVARPCPSLAEHHCLYLAIILGTS